MNNKVKLKYGYLQDKNNPRNKKVGSSSKEENKVGKWQDFRVEVKRGGKIRVEPEKERVSQKKEVSEKRKRLMISFMEGSVGSSGNISTSEESGELRYFCECGLCIDCMSSE